MSVLKVRGHYTKDAVCIHRGTSLRDISEIILERKFSILPVIEEGKYSGVVTITELLSVFIPEYLDMFEHFGFAAKLDLDLEIAPFIDDLIVAEDILEVDYPTFTEDTNLIIAVAQLNKYKVPGAPVIEDDKVKGVITLKDICSALICYKNTCPLSL